VIAKKGHQFGVDRDQALDNITRVPNLNPAGTSP
jgi:hypothetical protein